MTRPAFKELERLERAVDVDEPANVQAPVTRSEAADGSGAARGLSLAILVSVVIWLFIVAVVAVALS